MKYTYLLQDLEELENILHFTIAGIEQDIDPDKRIISALCGIENRLREIIDEARHDKAKQDQDE